MMKMKTTISKENMERETFVFYRSYFDAIELLSKKNRLLAYEAIAKYALTQEEIQDLPPQVAIILKWLSLILMRLFEITIEELRVRDKKKHLILRISLMKRYNYQEKKVPQL